MPLYWRCRPHFSQQAHIDVTFIRDLRTWVRSINNFRVSNFPEISRWMLTSCWSVSYLTVHTKQCLRRRYFFCLSASRITQNFHECLTTSIIGRGTSNRRLDVGSDLDPDPGIFLHRRQWSSTEVAPYRHSLVGITSPSRLQEICSLSAVSIVITAKFVYSDTRSLSCRLKLLFIIYSLRRSSTWNI